ncbi:MucR family transcriptional regulator [uncultured Methylobacterium sp.]|uniref:MucR family transcriptional regulator n=1 Tax=uncultured Methylobacterium sp. TaxID=157278 RepID=UPI00262D15CE|nr:MucR family transcriptional regulator [uncultured Methylobacterium sp.]
MSDSGLVEGSLAELTSDIVSAYVSKNSVPLADLPSLIASVHASLSALGQPAAQAAEDHRVTPAQIRKSITPDHLVSFLDGRSYKSLKRHLTSHGTSPDEYRRKFGLGHDYPMVAASYAAQRSELAKSLGLGQQRRRAAEAAGSAPARRGRPRKAAAE